ncbi:MAG: type II secretion system ATPase GspE [Deltaproteobacteria bacterium]|jgi:general secretion pathway protein E|nr:type II secretion system ATPase GspE [Deltaproteobacteria bacterium]
MLDKIVAEIIQEKKGISSEAAADLLNGQKGKSFGTLAVEKGLLTEDELLTSLSKKLRVPYVKNLEEEGLDPSLVSRVPIVFSKKHKVVPMKMEDGILTVATPDPLNYEPLDDLRLIIECQEVRVVLSSEREVVRAINRFYEQSADTPEEMIQSMDAESSDRILHELEETADLLDISDEAPVIKLVNLILFQAVKERASDIHIEPFQKELKVRYRIDGILYQRLDPPKRYQSAIVSRLKVMAKMDIAEKRLPQDGRIPIKIADKDIDIRVSIIPTTFGERVVLRLLDKQSLLLGMGEIGLSPDKHQTLQDLISRSNGILLVTGPTGSGKTTTLYAALSQINSPDKNIITIEDPVEYQLWGIGQIQVNPKIGLTFAHGLRSVLRHDPDVILVGEIRDAETAEIAIQAALTGHLVFSTLHTNNAASAATRLVDMEIEPFLVASVVRAIVAQRLIRVICSECKEGYVPEPEMLKEVGITPEQLKGGKVYRGKGCPACSGTGYRGRTGIYEILLVSETIRQLIMKKADSVSIGRQAVEEGMKTLREDGARKIIEGITALEEVLRVTQD